MSDNFQIQFPRIILQDNRLTKLMKNILMDMYLYRNADGICRRHVKMIAKDLGIRSYLTITNLIKRMPCYVEILEHPTDRRKIEYKMLIDNKKDFIELDSMIYKRYCKIEMQDKNDKTYKDNDLIVEYFMHKNTYFLVRTLFAQGGIKSCGIFEHCRLGGYEYEEFCIIHKRLFDNGLITDCEYYIKYIQEPDTEKEIKEFLHNSKGLVR